MLFGMFCCGANLKLANLATPELSHVVRIDWLKSAAERALQAFVNVCPLPSKEYCGLTAAMSNR